MDVQYSRLCERVPHHPDCLLMRALMVRVTDNRVVWFTLLEAYVLLRQLRSRHKELDDDMMALEERRLRGGHDGELDAAWHALDADSTILEDVLRRLWELLAH